MLTTRSMAASWVIGLLMASVLFAAPLKAATDVRLLIDVSGSMRQNDPDNLRVPALSLVTELLPSGGQAGVWVFAENVEPLVAPAAVDDAWKQRARAALKRIHSRGLYTDIERALDAASRDWTTADPEQDRHIVLLTDGVVDVSKNDAEDAASRARITGEQIKRLKALGVKVHVVALSEGVDAELMRILSDRTDGWLEAPRDADALQRVFLHMLEQSAPPTTLPLEGNRFSVDDQVSEFTLLAFRAAEGSTRLVSPDDRLISVSNPGEGVSWRADAGYDLVTVTAPLAGDWELLGAEDPDNRVAVVTDLGIDATPLPALIHSGDTLALEVWLTSEGLPVSRADLLELLSGRARLIPLESEAGAIELPLTFDAASQRFKGELKANALTPGLYDLTLILDGGAFERQLQRRLRLAPPPVTVRYEGRPPSPEGAPARLRIIINAEPDQIEPESLFGYVRVQRPDESLTVLELGPLSEIPMLYEVVADIPGTYDVRTRLAVRAQTGRSIVVEPPEERFQFEFELPEQPPEEDSEKPRDGSFSWLALALYLLGGNSLLAALLGLIWWLRGPHRAPRPDMNAEEKAA
ncbi:MAG: VWA domain-containing protein [Chromatiaceae bacterium]|nr:VWA domain-containing protein [Chromatiaceae bacterium]